MRSFPHEHADLHRTSEQILSIVDGRYELPGTLPDSLLGDLELIYEVEGPGERELLWFGDVMDWAQDYLG